MTIDIKTLDEILAADKKTVKIPTVVAAKTAKTPSTSSPKAREPSKISQRKTNPTKPKPTKTKHTSTPPANKPVPTNTTAPTQTTALTGKEVILSALAQVEREPLYNNDRRHNYLRWLAFYYLSKRELSRYELSQKLSAKGFEAKEIDALLEEFIEKGYQSDYRYAQAIIKEALRTGKGERAILQKFFQSKLDLASLGLELKTLIQTTKAEFDRTDTPDDEALDTDEAIDWLRLAVETRTKKYGDSLPKDAKEKAKQFRFLQYRGFQTEICFDALKKTLADF